MDEPRLDELMHRIATLEQDKRRWKLIGISALVVIALLLLGDIFFLGAAVLIQAQHAQALRAERAAALQAQQAENEARQQAEDARHEAEQRAKRAEQKAKAADK